jgi:hypothetical protein
VAKKKTGNGSHKPTIEELLQVLISETRTGFDQLRTELRTGLAAVNGRLDNLIATAGAGDRKLGARIDDLEARVIKLEAK